MKISCKDLNLGNHQLRTAVSTFWGHPQHKDHNPSSEDFEETPCFCKKIDSKSRLNRAKKKERVIKKVQSQQPSKTIQSNSVDYALWYSFVQFYKAYKTSIQGKTTSEIKISILKRYSDAEIDKIIKQYLALKRYACIPLNCQICDIKTTELEPLLDHFKSNKHSKKLQKLQKLVDLKEYHRRVNLLEALVNLRKSNIFLCQLCSLIFEKRSSYNDHNKSKKHKKQLYQSYCAVVVMESMHPELGDDKMVELFAKLDQL